MRALFQGSALALALLLAGCGDNHGRYHVNKNPAFVTRAMDEVLREVNPASTTMAAGEQSKAVNVMRQLEGQEWLFTGEDSRQTLRLQIGVNHLTNDETDLTLQVEVPTPYVRNINGTSVTINQATADQYLQTAFRQMTDQLNKEGWRDIDQDPGTPAAPVVAVLKELVPRNGEAYGTPWAS